jgi:hypothetical protein
VTAAAPPPGDDAMVFRGDGAGAEDALTLLIMADQRVARDVRQGLLR